MVQEVEPKAEYVSFNMCIGATMVIQFMVHIYQEPLVDLLNDKTAIEFQITSRSILKLMVNGLTRSTSV